ncbi:MAG: GNAT family N-acetyltransferase [Thermoleophilaceae bacterium]|nr:GNAT family N-acetyltransferase [Thermoleophilaceae bacterium]
MALHLRGTGTAEHDFVLSAESDPEAADFILPRSRHEHERALDDPDQAHLLVADDDRPVGFVLLAGILDKNRSIEMRRIVVSPPGKGLGRPALPLVLDHAFGALGAHKSFVSLAVMSILAPEWAARRLKKSD